MEKAKIVFIVMIIIFILIVILNCAQTIPTGFVGIKTRFGKAQDGIIQEGLHFTIPFIERIEKIDCAGQCQKVLPYL